MSSHEDAAVTASSPSALPLWHCAVGRVGLIHTPERPRRLPPHGRTRILAQMPSQRFDCALVVRILLPLFVRSSDTAFRYCLQPRSPSWAPIRRLYVPGRMGGCLH
jgi:hypothetical protein